MSSVRASAAAEHSVNAIAITRRKSMSDPQSTTIIVVAGLTKQVTTGDTPLTILRDVSFSVHAGEAVAIVGVSGSGKSTLLALLAGLDTPTSGSVRINGDDLYALNE